FPGRALRACGIERAELRRAERALRDAVARVARRERGGGEHAELAGAQALRPRHVLLRQDAETHQRGPVGGRRAGHDRVIVLGEALRLLEPLPAARRAAVPVRLVRAFAVARGGHGFADDRELVHRAVRVIGELVGTTDGPREVAARALVPGVRVRDRVAACERLGERAPYDRPSGSAVAGLHELAVPAFGREPDLEA